MLPGMGPLLLGNGENIPPSLPMRGHEICLGRSELTLSELPEQPALADSRRSGSRPHNLSPMPEDTKVALIREEVEPGIRQSFCNVPPHLLEEDLICFLVGPSYMPELYRHSCEKRLLYRPTLAFWVPKTCL